MCQEPVSVDVRVRSRLTPLGPKGNKMGSLEECLGREAGKRRDIDPGSSRNSGSPKTEQVAHSRRTVPFAKVWRQRNGRIECISVKLGRRPGLEPHSNALSGHRRTWSALFDRRGHVASIFGWTRGSMRRAESGFCKNTRQVPHITDALLWAAKDLFI